MQLQGTNTYLIGTGHERILIDTGEGEESWIQLVMSVIRERNLIIDKVLLTHWHGDHTGGVSDLLHHYPHLQDCIYKSKPDLGQQPIVDGQQFHVPGATLRAVFTPGHSVDHMCFHFIEESSLITGDNILGHGTTAVEDLAQYMQSLRIMQSISCEKGLPGHGAVIPDLRRKLSEEVGSKERRERQILAGLKSFQTSRPTSTMGATAKELVSQVFGQLPDDTSSDIFEPFMRELLMKLASEKRVGFVLREGKKQWFCNVR